MNGKISIRENKYSDGILISTTHIYNNKLQEGQIQKLNDDEIKDLIDALSKYVGKYPTTEENQRTSEKGKLIFDGYENYS